MAMKRRRFTTAARPARRFSSRSPRDSDHPEKLTVTCGSSGSITIDLYNPSALLSPSTPLLIYLPSSPSHRPTTTTGVRKCLPAQPLACINYRWNQNPASLSRRCAFPTPLHDSLHAYSFLTANLLPTFATAPKAARPVYIYGSKLGGTLATSLALTESHTSTANQAGVKIAGLIAKDAIFDWTGIATSTPASQSPPPSPSSKRDPKSQDTRNEDELPQESDGPEKWDDQGLHALKRRLFDRPASCFDSFASPLLFFRTTGLAIPSSWPGESGVDKGSSSSSENPNSFLLPGSEYEDVDSEIGRDVDENGVNGKQSTDQPHVSRKSHLRFPPKHSDLRIPRSLFLATGAAIERQEKAFLVSQMQEMVKVMRRSLVLYEFKERAMWDDDFGDPLAMAEERVRLYEIQGLDADEEEEGEVIRAWIDDAT